MVYRKGTRIFLKVRGGEIRGKVLDDDKFRYLGLNSKKEQIRRQVVVRAKGKTYYVDAARVKKRLI